MDFSKNPIVFDVNEELNGNIGEWLKFHRGGSTRIVLSAVNEAATTIPSIYTTSAADTTVIPEYTDLTIGRDLYWAVLAGLGLLLVLVFSALYIIVNNEVRNCRERRNTNRLIHEDDV